MSTLDIIRHAERAKALNIRSGLQLIPIGVFLLAVAWFGPTVSAIGVPLTLGAVFYLKKRQRDRFGAVEPSKAMTTKTLFFTFTVGAIMLGTILFDIYENGPAQRMPVYLTPIVALVVIVLDNATRRRNGILTPWHWLPAAVCVAGALLPFYVNTMNADFLSSVAKTEYGFDGNYWGSFVSYGVLGVSLLIFGFLDHRNQVNTSKAVSHVS